MTDRVIVVGSGFQGPRGKSILNGNGAPSSNLGIIGDFYYDKTTTRFYGPKLTNISWDGVTNFILDKESNLASILGFVRTWDIAQLSGPVGGIYSISITHNLGFFPNATVKDSGGNELELGIDYNSNNQITLKMAQPFGGTVYLS
jgi:hypothetical protein